jgi:2-polyprenyl-3-methyl-5-hydroxy-6-metoxy-1,4-benzoquinol methylase
MSRASSGLPAESRSKGMVPNAAEVAGSPRGADLPVVKAAAGRRVRLGEASRLAWTQDTRLETSRGQECGVVMGQFERPLMYGTLSKRRNDAILAIVEGRRVIHVGCTDAPFTAEKIKSSKLLHPQLARHASEVMGVDIDESGIHMLSQHHPGAYQVLDLTGGCADISALVTFQPDVLLAGDVIEHLADPGSLLRGLARVARAVGDTTEIVISTPNALAPRHAIYGMFGREVVHPDHLVTFTPQTMQRLCESSGLSVSRFYFYRVASGDGVGRRLLDGALRPLTSLRPGLGDGMIVVATVAQM